MISAESEFSTNFKLRLLDLSAQGAGLIDLTGLTQSTLMIGDQISINRLCGQSLEKRLSAKIVYTKDILDPHSKIPKILRRLGIKFSHDIDNFKYIIPFLPAKKNPMD